MLHRNFAFFHYSLLAHCIRCSFAVCVANAHHRFHQFSSRNWDKHRHTNRILDRAKRNACNHVTTGDMYHWNGIPKHIYKPFERELLWWSVVYRKMKCVLYTNRQNLLFHFSFVFSQEPSYHHQPLDSCICFCSPQHQFVFSSFLYIFTSTRNAWNSFCSTHTHCEHRPLVWQASCWCCFHSSLPILYVRRGLESKWNL